MKQEFRLYQRKNGIFYLHHNQTGTQESLKTSDRMQAERLCHARNEAHIQPQINREIAQAYLAACDPESKRRTWQAVMQALVSSKVGENKDRYQRAMEAAAFDVIRKVVLIDTKPEHLLKCLQAEGQKVSTNYYLRRLHNFAIDMQWLLRPVLNRQTWPKIKHPKKRAIKLAEYEMILERESNAERKLFYQMLWHLGGSQTDVARLRAENIDRDHRIICYERAKMDELEEQPPALVHYGDAVSNVLNKLPEEGFLFPRLASMHCKHRATEFRDRCDRLGIKGVTLHSFRYAWAERARTVGMPERFAAEVLGHKSKAIHRAYARGAEVKVPSLEEYEKVFAQSNVLTVKFSKMEISAAREEKPEKQGDCVAAS